MTFYIQMMTEKDYMAYMSGSNNYTIIERNIEAETAFEAYDKAKAEFPEYIVNTYVESLAEIKEREEKAKEEAKRLEAKKNAAKERKAAREAEKAAAAGMTIETYNRYKRLIAGINRRETEIKNLENEIERLKKEIEEKKAEVEKIKD